MGIESRIKASDFPNIPKAGELLDHLSERFVRIKAAALPDRLLVLINGGTEKGRSSLIKGILGAVAVERMPNAIIDFNPDQTKGRYQGEDGFRNLIIDIGTQLSVGQILTFRGFQITPLSSLSTPEVLDKLLEYVTDFHNYNGRRPAVVAFDSVEQCDQSLLEKIPGELAVPLLMTEKTVVIVAGQDISYIKYPLPQRQREVFQLDL